MGNTSVSETVSREISKTFMSMLVENTMRCQAQANEEFSMDMQVGGNLEIEELGADLSAVQQISCLSSQDLQAAMTDKFKSDLESKVSEELKGFATGANTSVERTKNEIVNYLTTDTTIRNIEEQLAVANEKIKFSFQVGGDAKIGKATASASIDQIVNGTATQIQKIIKETAMESTTKSTTSELLDGFMSGTVFTQIILIVVVGGVITAIIAAIIKIFSSKKQEEVYYDYDYYDFQSQSY